MVAMSSSAVLRLAAVVASGGLRALAEPQSHSELFNSTAPGVAANSTDPAVLLPLGPEGVQSLASLPFWCTLIPDALKPEECLRTSTPPPAGAQQPARCQGMPADQRAADAACSYSEQEAIQFASLCAATYCQMEDWHCGKPCDAAPDMSSVRRVDDDSLDAHAYVGRLGEACVLAFRGTDSLTGWAQDFASVKLAELPGCSFDGKNCKVGAGFLEDYQAVTGRIQGQLSAIGCTKSTPLFVTGHSLGAALATLALFDLKRLGYNTAKAYTFGQPRVGDSTFAGAFNEAMASTPVHRVTKRDDPFVYLPPRDPFHHVGTEVYYKGDSSEGYRICDGSGEDASCQDATGNGDDVASLLLKCIVPQECGHLNYLQPSMTIMLSGASCTRRTGSDILFP